MFRVTLAYATCVLPRPRIPNSCRSPTSLRPNSEMSPVTTKSAPRMDWLWDLNCASCLVSARLSRSNTLKRWDCCRWAIRVVLAWLPRRSTPSVKMPRMKPERLSNLPTETGTRVPRNGVAADSTLATSTLRDDSVAQPYAPRRTAVAITVTGNRDMTPPQVSGCGDIVVYRRPQGDSNSRSCREGAKTPTPTAP